MPLNISKVGKVLKTLNRLNTPTEFNATLPVKVEIKKEINPITYLIKLGNRETETKSYIPLEVGKKYLAQIKEFKNKIQITNLKELPKLMEILENTDIPEGFKHYNKEEILKHLSTSKDKNEFMFFANFLLALEKKIYHLTIREKKKKSLMQYKYFKNKVSFYSVFSHLGEIEGEIYPYKAVLKSPYENVIQLIEYYKKEIDLEIETILKEPKPLYEFKNSLLDLKV
ncbi:MAG: hypothetical protein ABGX25_02275 [Nautiliaceae bacterium]